MLGSGKTDAAWAFTKEDILNVVKLDLETVFLTCNGKTWRQKQGCPIGGFLSAAYANIKCMYDEYKFLRGLRNDARKIYAIRQMDDLIMWIAYDERKKDTKRWAEGMKKRIMKGGLYKGGLVLEEQKEEPEEKKKKFCGVWIIKEGEGVNTKFRITPRNPNEEELLRTGVQKQPRFINAKAWTNQHYKKGLIIGNYHRIETQTTERKDLIWAVMVNMLEMRVCGYKEKDLLIGIRSMIHKYKRWGSMEKQVRDIARIQCRNWEQHDEVNRTIKEDTPPRQSKLK